MNALDSRLKAINDFRDSDGKKVAAEVDKLAVDILSLDPYLKRDRYWYDLTRSLFTILCFIFFLKSTNEATEFMLDNLNDITALSHQIGYFSIFYGSEDVNLPIEFMDLRGSNLEQAALILKRCIEKSKLLAARSRAHAVKKDALYIDSIKTHAEKLFIPTFRGFKTTITKNTSPAIIYAFTNGRGLSYSLVSDGPIMSDSLETRINRTIENSRKFAKTLSEDNQDEFIFPYKEFKNKDFHFKIYVQDSIINRKKSQKYIRQLNAYFIDEKMGDFYQLTASAGVFDYPSQKITLGKLSRPRDQVTRTLDNMLIALMTGIKYK